MDDVTAIDEWCQCGYRRFEHQPNHPQRAAHAGEHPLGEVFKRSIFFNEGKVPASFLAKK